MDPDTNPENQENPENPQNMEDENDIKNMPSSEIPNYKSGNPEEDEENIMDQANIENGEEDEEIGDAEDMEKQLEMEENQNKEEQKELTDVEKYFYLSKLNLIAGRYEEMLDNIENFIVAKPNINKEERKFINSAYKTVLGPKRKSWWTVKNLEKKEDKKNIKSYHNEIKTGIEIEIKELCGKMINLLDNFLIPNGINDESRGYFLNLKGDYYRYLCEISTGDDLKMYQDIAKEAYLKAKEYCKYFNILNSTKLSINLNYSIFLYEMLGMKKEAISLARKTYEDAVTKIENKGEQNIEKAVAKDSLFLIQLIKENFLFWSGENMD